MSMIEVSEWLYNTPMSQAIQGAGWIIPTTQSVHIVAITVLIGSAIVLDLKLAGVLARADAPSAVYRRYMPWLWWALVVLVATGALLIVAEPERVLMNWVFWTKMALLLGGFVITLLMRSAMLQQQSQYEGGAISVLLKPLGLLSVAIWVLIIFCGRWIAYAI